MNYIHNEAFPEDSDYLEGLVHEEPEANINLYRTPTDGIVKYLLVSIKYMLNLLFECQGEKEGDIINYGRLILQVGNITKNHCATPDRERAEVRAYCISDHCAELDFSIHNARILEENGGQLYYDSINNTWAIFIDSIELYRFRNETNARQVFAYVDRDIRQSSDKWLSVIDENPTRF